MAVNKKNLNTSLILIVTTIVTSFIHFVVNLILARHLSIESFGIFIFLGNIVALIVIITGAYSSTVAQSVSEEYGRTRNAKLILPNKGVLLNIILISTIATLLWIFLVPFINSTTHISENVLFGFTPVISFLLLYGVYRGVLGGFFYFNLIALIIGLEAIIRTVISLFALNTENLPLVYAAFPISISFGFLLTLLIFKNKFKKIDKSEIINVSPSNKLFASLIIISTTTSIIFTIDMILVKFIFSPMIAGQYALLATIGRIIVVFNSLLTYLLVLFASYEKSHLQEKRIFGIVLGVNLAIGISYIIAFGLLGKYTTGLLIGENSLSIISHLIPYTFAISLISVTEIFIIYHILKKEYKYIYIVLATAIMLVSGISIFHKSLDNIVSVLVVLSIFSFFATVCLHTIDSVKAREFLFLREIWFLFKKNKINSRSSVLFTNRKSMSHPESGGAETYSDRISKYLRDSGKEIVMLTNNEENGPHYENIGGIHYIRIGGFVSSYFLIPLYVIFHFRKKVDTIIDVHNAIPFFTPLFLRARKNILIIHHVHTHIFEKYLPFGLSHIANTLESKIMPWVYRDSQIVTVSDSTYKDALQIGFRQKNMTIIHNGIDDPNENFFEDKKEYPLITYFGRVEKYKRVDFIIEALREIRLEIPEIHLVIAGSGGHIDELKSRSKDSGLHHKITFLGFVSEEDKVRILSSSWISIQPSEMEGWGITIIESNSYQTPVIGFDVPGICDSVLDKKTGLLCKNNSSKSLATAIITLIKDGSYLLKLSRNSREWAEKFSWSASGEKFKKIINE